MDQHKLNSNIIKWTINSLCLIIIAIMDAIVSFLIGVILGGEPKKDDWDFKEELTIGLNKKDQERVKHNKYYYFLYKALKFFFTIFFVLFFLGLIFFAINIFMM